MTFTLYFNESALSLIYVISFWLCLVTFWEFPKLSQSIEMSLFTYYHIYGEFSFLIQIKSKWCVAFFFPAQKTKQNWNVCALNRFAQCSPTSHIAQSWTFEKNSLGNSRKPNSSSDQGGRENATQRENAVRCLFGESLYTWEQFENKLLFKNLWLGVKAGEWIVQSYSFFLFLIHEKLRRNGKKVRAPYLCLQSSRRARSILHIV